VLKVVEELVDLDCDRRTQLMTFHTPKYICVSAAKAFQALTIRVVNFGKFLFLQIPSIFFIVIGHKDGGK